MIRSKKSSTLDLINDFLIGYEGGGVFYTLVFWEGRFFMGLTGQEWKNKALAGIIIAAIITITTFYLCR